MKISTVCLALGLALLAGGRADAQDFLNQDWTLDPRQSHVWMQTTKNETTVEKHQFTAVEGGVTRDGNATVKIELGSIDTSIDLRNVRMRFLLFETFSSPRGDIAQLNKARLGLAVGSTVRPLVLNVNMHGSRTRSRRGSGHAPARHRLGGEHRADRRRGGKLRLRQGPGKSLGRRRRHQDQAVGGGHLQPGVRERRAEARARCGAHQPGTDPPQQETAALSTEAARTGSPR